MPAREEHLLIGLIPALIISAGLYFVSNFFFPFGVENFFSPLIWTAVGCVVSDVIDPYWEGRHNHRTIRGHGRWALRPSKLLAIVTLILGIGELFLFRRVALLLNVAGFSGGLYLHLKADSKTKMGLVG